VVETTCHEQETIFVNVGNIVEKDVEVLHHEEEVGHVDANDMKEEILDIKDDDACVEILTSSPFWMVFLILKYFSFQS
jgi:hypothetical protein